MTGRHHATVSPGPLFDWIARSRLRIVLFCLAGAGLVAGGILQAHRTDVRIRHLVATGEPVQATMEGFKFGDHARYVIHGRTWNVPLESAWGNGPGYSRGEAVTIYASQNDPQFVATRDGYVTSSVRTHAPFPLIGTGVLVILLAGPALATWAARANPATPTRGERTHPSI
ncbi:hypothetical protein [Micromonospora tulbaghiae]|uniref:hypothetical protein n=1 Tax=Micromonospora tulbaghiae TaxID=479978 RepID=UPI0036961F1E